MRKIAFIVSSLDTGGAQRAVSNIVTNWPDNWEIDIILNNATIIKYPYKGNIIDLKIKEPKNRKSVLYQLKVFFKRFRRIKSLKRKRKYDACISFLDSANIVNILTKTAKTKTIVSVRCELSQDNSFSYRYILTPMVKHLYNKADKVVSLSKGVEKDLVSNFGLEPQKNCTIYNCYNLQKMKMLANSEDNVLDDLGENEVCFISMGRFTYQKGGWHLIRAFAKLVHDGYKCKLVLLGTGELKEYYEKLVEEYNIEKSVDIVGFADNPFVYLKKATCFVFPSLFEGFGNALIEALACDLPVISSDFKSGAREILAPGTNIDFHVMDEIEYAKYGILVPVCEGKYFGAEEKLTKNEMIMYRAMTEIINNKELRDMYKKNAHLCVEQYEPQNIIKQWIDLIEE